MVVVAENVEGTTKIEERCLLTPIEKYRVSAIDPKYAAVKGSLGPETRCIMY